MGVTNKAKLLDDLLSKVGAKPAMQPLKNYDGAETFGVEVEFDGSKFVVVQDLGNGFGIAAPVGAKFPAPLVLIPLRYVAR